MVVHSTDEKKPGTPLRFGLPPGPIGEPTGDRLPLAERVAAKILARQAAQVPDRPFVRCHEQLITYAQADRRANQTANMLAQFGISKGDRVAIFSRNRVEYLDLWFALARLGAIQVPINTEYKSAQIAHVFKRAPIAAIVVEEDLLPELLLSLSQVDPRPGIFLLAGSTDRSEYTNGREPCMIDYARAVQNADGSAPPGAEAVSGADIGLVMNTSGTTGPSKGVLMPHAQQYILGRMIAADMELTADDIYYNCFLLFHNTAQAMITIPVMLVGAQMVLTDRFSASQFWREISEYRCTAFYYIGEIIRILLKSTTADDARGSRLRVGWGIGASARDFVEFGTRFEVQMRTGYGSTEANVPCYLPHDSTNPASCGRVVPGFEVRIANETGESVAAGETGEILVRSSEPCALMHGYDNEPAATVAAWRDLWFHSGDAGSMDSCGNLYFKGRVKDSIRVRGENISAFEVEQAISEVDGVVEVAAIAVPGELGGDDLKIVVVCRPDAQVTPERLIAHANAYLPRFSIPRYVEFVSELPKTPTNKIQKHILRADPFNSQTWDRAKS